MTDEKSRDPRTHAVIGAAMEVHSVLGRGFLEPVYQAALAVEMDDRGIPYLREAALPVHYKGRKLECHYRADFICFGEVIVEIKALDQLGTPQEAQLLNYLKATGMEVGLLVNFGAARLQFKRMVLTPTDRGEEKSSADERR